MKSTHHARSRPRRVVAAVAALTATAALAACSGSSVSAGNKPADSAARRPSGQVGELLTVGFPAAPPSLDPAKSAGNASIFFSALTYEPLIVINSKGKFEPGLAESWEYGDHNKTFVLHLRKGVKFSDGSPLTARSVVDYFGYLQTQGGQNRALFKGDTFAATGPLQVTITFDQPNPDIIYNLTQDIMAGEVISPAGLANPAALGAQSFGAGPYVLSKNETSLGSQYTFVPNPTYYDTSKQHYKKIVIKIIQSPQSTLQALQTGQIDMALGDQSTRKAAEAAGFVYPPADVTNNVSVVTLADRAGQLVPALRDVRVRRALNYATDRKAIVDALFPGNTPTSQVATKGRNGYDEAGVDAYPHDVAKAKGLLAEAGYAGGFSMDLVTTPTGSQNLYAQAIAQQWKEIGVTVNVVEIANGQAYVKEALSAKYAAFTNNVNIRPIATLGTNLFLPQAVYNPFHSDDAALRTLYGQGLLASGGRKAELDKQVVRHLTEQAWFVPIVAQVLPVYVGPKVYGADVTPPMAFPSVYELQPAKQ